MRIVPAVSYANIFMARKIDPKLLAAAEKYRFNGRSPIVFMKRFLDDIKMVWRGSTEDLHKFLSDINKIHSSIKFTMSHTTKALFTNDVYKPYHHPMLQIMCVDGTVQGVLQRMIVDETL